MTPAETAIDTTSRVCETNSGYLWYICTWTTPFYSGCCRVNPCQNTPIGCPPQARGHSDSSTAYISVTKTLTVTRAVTSTSLSPSSTSLSPSPFSSTSTPVPGASAPSPPTISSTSTANIDQGSGDGLSIPINTLAGIVVGCGIVVIFVALVACMWWGRRRRKKRERSDHTERLPSSRGLGDEQIPPGLESIFNPMAHSGPGSVFDRTEGRMAKADSMLGFSPLTHGPLTHGPRRSTVRHGAHSGIVSPLTPGSSWGSGLPSSPSEPDSTLVHGDVTKSGEGNEGAKPGSEPEVKEADAVPRATLNSTEQERETRTYVNSWTRFQNVQL
ncbi:uncharacterized protein B0H64DRAFT_91161 [Chaetomium fimeti]|uniref:Uncharacterized protein n=1 Tax=Chaetomium fimeti TaxID=1854472 RepID=A0AAE0LVQ1_9PEZI|nr:hypothetical protein B0H64DRAFT_91161 [Chaetomium fimeti]